MRKIFISKKGEWFEEGTIAIPYMGIVGERMEDSTIDDEVAVFTGVPNRNPELSSDFHSNLVLDEELCSTDEFDIIEVEDNVYEAIFKTFKTMYDR